MLLLRMLHFKIKIYVNQLNLFDKLVIVIVVRVKNSIGTYVLNYITCRNMYFV